VKYIAKRDPYVSSLHVCFRVPVTEAREHEVWSKISRSRQNCAACNSEYLHRSHTSGDSSAGECKGRL
jgi:hypothetical protein